MHGAARAGKTAIAQTIAEMCLDNGILVASFFFFRMDPTRNTINPVVATLAYQIIRLLPDTKAMIIQAIDSNPLIFCQSFDTQIRELITQPLRRLQRAGVPWELVIIIDGLGECRGEKNQVYLINTLAKLLSSKDLLLYALISSRLENQVKMAFGARHVISTTLYIPLDDHNSYIPDNDIALYLNNSFQSIHQSHPLGHCLPPDWPPPSYILEISEKVSGQFIYAAVVVKFISHANASPASQLEIVCGLCPLGRSTPFAELDALYCHIFSTVSNLQATMNCLAYVILRNEGNPFKVTHFFNLPVDDIYAAFSGLTSVINCGRVDICFLHATLPDFLLDKARSCKYYIDRSILSTELSIVWYDAYALCRLPG